MFNAAASTVRRFVRTHSGALRATAAAALVTLVGVSTVAQAQTSLVYPNKGQYNATTYSFTAAATGDVLAYMVGGFGAAYTNELGLMINGQLSSSGFGLNNHSTQIGQVFNLGHVSAGDALTFVLRNYTLNQDVYSDASLNTRYDLSTATGHNHIYSTSYNGSLGNYPGVPAGTFVAFEDQRLPASDFNYNDLSFVFTNVSTLAITTLSSAVPEPQTQGMLLSGLAALALVGARRRRAGL